MMSLNNICKVFYIEDLTQVIIFVLLYAPINRYAHGGTVSSPNHTFSWASLDKQLTSNSCTYFRLNISAEGRRMTVEIIS